jgi:hypothetical protein
MPSIRMGTPLVGVVRAAAGGTGPKSRSPPVGGRAANR